MKSNERQIIIRVNFTFRHARNLIRTVFQVLFFLVFLIKLINLNVANEVGKCSSSSLIQYLNDQSDYYRIEAIILT